MTIASGDSPARRRSRRPAKYLAVSIRRGSKFRRALLPEAKRFHERNKAKTNNIVATKALAHACYHIRGEGKPFNATRRFAQRTTAIRRNGHGSNTVAGRNEVFDSWRYQKCFAPAVAGDHATLATGRPLRLDRSLTGSTTPAYLAHKQSRVYQRPGLLGGARNETVLDKEPSCSLPGSGGDHRPQYR
jgi:hypothetical protein